MEYPIPILVVGDWVIDDHWVAGIHRSSTSTRTGRTHYRALHPLESTVQSMGAAARTASVLHRAKCGPKTFAGLSGLGLWHASDTEEMSRRLLPVPRDAQRNPYTISRTPLRTTTGIAAQLFNLNDERWVDHPDGYGTSRVIRVYQHTGDKLELMHRVDWELQDPIDEPKWRRRNCEALRGSVLERDIQNKNLKSILIYDVCKGVVCKQLVEWLAATAPNVSWFVCTKEWNPEWLAALHGMDVRLLMFHQVAARMALNRDLLSRWITGQGYASSEALELVDSVAAGFESPPFVVVLPDRMRVLAKYETDGREKGAIQTMLDPRPTSVGVPMASVFFASLMAQMIDEDEKKDNAVEADAEGGVGGVADGDDEPSRDFLMLLKSGLEFTQDVMKHESEQVKRYSDWDPEGEKTLDLGNLPSGQDCGTWKEFCWDNAKDSWHDAYCNRCIVERRGRKCIELWRAMTELDGYVCCVDSKRRKIRRLIQKIRPSWEERGGRTKSFMLVASPGTGKSYLVKCLAKMLKMNYMPFNITTMLTRGDILDCFDRIATTQVEQKNRTVLAFFDEINAVLDGHYVYDMFLGPIERGIYVRAGKNFHIEPCVWIFAGTEALVKEKDPQRDRSSKASDLQSRLTHAPLKLGRSDGTEDAQVHLENVYLGVSLLRKQFPDVAKISEKVLKLFHLLPTTLDVRDMEHFTKSFRDIQYGEVLAKNVPGHWLRDNVRQSFAVWSELRESKQRIEIVG
jgi:hypothetical protein